MTELPNGRTIEEIAKMARHVAHTYPSRLIDIDEAQDVAACALVEALYSTETPPTDRTLFRAASSAVGAANNGYAHFVGVDRNAARSKRVGMPPGYVTYWRSDHILAAPWEETLIEHIAVTQVWARLSPQHREVLRALAVQGSHEAARESLNLDLNVWRRRIYSARRQARELWFGPESAPPQWGRDRVGRERGNRAIKSLARRAKVTAA